MTHDRRFIRTESALQTALLDLIRVTPYDAITIDQIVVRANIARKTFYAHHANKDELLWVSLSGLYERIVQKMNDLNPLTLLLDGKPLSYPLFVHVREYQVFYHWILIDSGRTDVITHIWDYMAEVSYHKHSPLRALSTQISVPPPLIAQILSGALLGAARWWLREGLTTSPESMAYTFSLLMAPGVLAAMGLDNEEEA
ncbi:MAG: TetR/AcrR family transcriptional regulator [Anaerolineae bacterium]|jgi:AcrR family transcriptional regulator|nr:TetR/AcrR family transcriptional regulator [Anaerolineae bacterium]